MQELSDERLGRFTASSIYKLFMGGKTRDTYIFEKAEEIVKGHIKRFRTKDTEHGLDNEYEAIQALKEVEGLICEPLDNKFFKINKNCGATPDAAIYNFSNIITASVDAKCPTESFFQQKMIQLRNAKKEYQSSENDKAKIHMFKELWLIPHFFKTFQLVAIPNN